MTVAEQVLYFIALPVVLAVLAWIGVKVFEWKNTRPH